MLFKTFTVCGHYTLRSIRKSSTTMVQTVKVQVKQGVIVGQQRILPEGRFNSFQGVPYALPPLGDLRFKSPVPLERFDEPELNCTKERDVSHQRDPFTQEVVGSENCLFLNLYVPVTQHRRHLPVMVWIHGGGFFFGNGNSDYFYPLSLLENEVVVVTLNYRLGALGFLSLPEQNVWGNAGLKDQRLALQWVHDNISQFGGDPHNVTLFGESAGAAAIHLHAYARHANKLFHKAIMQSGTANMEWVFQSNPDYKARRLSKLLGCTSNNSQQILEFLQSKQVTPLDILEKTISVLTPDERRRGLPLPFKPIIEDPSSPDSFINSPIMERLQAKNTISLPTLMGYNSAEGIAMTVNAVRKLPDIDKDLSRFVPRNIPLPLDHSSVKELAQKMREFYLNGQALGPKMLNAFTDLLSDYHFIVDMVRAAELQVRQQPNAPLYFYRFQYVGENNMFKRIFNLERLKGACHGDELFYLFQLAGNEQQLNADDLLMVKRLSKLWTNFAKSGEPAPFGTEPPVIDSAWALVQRPKSSEDPFTLDYLAIDKHCEMLQDPDKERIEFWRNIYSNYRPTDYSILSAKL